MPVLVTAAAADEASVREVVAGAGLEPPSDVHASADYRRQLATVCAVRAVQQAADTRTVSVEEPSRSHSISVEVNGQLYEHDVDARRLLVHFIRDDIDLTGTHVGCDTGNCGACTIHLDGQAVKSCMLLAVQADGAKIDTVEGLRRRRGAEPAPAVVLRAPRAPVRLLHARDADERVRAARTEPAAERGGGADGDPGQHLPLHRLREHRRGDRERRRERMSTTETQTTTAPVELQKGFIGQSIPRKEDRRLVQGQGVFFDDVRRHGTGYVHFVRSPLAHAKILSIDVTAALALEGVYGTLTGDEVAIQTDPFFEMSTPPGANIKDYALAVGRVRFMGEPVAAVVARTRELARDAAELVEVEYEALDVLVDARESVKNETIMHDDAGSNVVWSGVFDWGDWEAAKAEADHIVKIDELHFHRFSSTPLECSGALVEYEQGTGQWTIHCNHQMPGVGAIWMAPALRTGIDKLRFITRDIGGGFGNKICLHPYYVTLCLLSRKLNRPVNWTEWRTDQHTANAHGNERWFQDVEVAVRSDGTMLGFNVKALDDCGAFPRYEPLGCIIWAQVTAGLYAWRNIRVDFTQVTTNKAPVSPNRGYSRMQHLWLTERIIDIVASELELDPVEIRKRNYVKTRADALRDAERLRLRLRRLRALPRHRARPDRLRLDRGTACRGGGAREAARHRDRLDARLGHEQLRPVAAAQPGTPVLGQQRSGDGEARHLRRGRRDAWHRPAGAGSRDDGVAGGRGHHRLLARPGARALRARHVLQLPRRLLGHLREPVRGDGPRRGEGRRRSPPRGDGHARGGRAPVRRRSRSSSRTASRGSRTARPRPRSRSWRSARS